MGDKDNQPTFTEIMNDPDYHRAMGLFESMCREMTEEGSKYKLHQIKFALLNAALEIADKAKTFEDQVRFLDASRTLARNRAEALAAENPKAREWCENFRDQKDYDTGARH
jgi:hypothetical protein